ncbi:MAG: DUF4174 domain-containing protein [Bacteroidia bacterium]
MKITALIFFFIAMLPQSPILQHRWNQRVVLVFSGEGSTLNQEQIAALLPGTPEWNDRKLALYDIQGEGGIDGDGNYISVEHSRQLRKGYGISLGEFVVILVGLDGKEKLRSTSPVNRQEIFNLIDTMPMRKTEMEGQKQHDP